MLQTIEIDGFRSLINFRLHLQPGLNVVVGSNGTGKSNFISFLDFLGTLIQFDLTAAIAVAQGAGSLFSKERFYGGKSAELTFKLSGQLRPPSQEHAALLPFADEDLQRLSGDYAYTCTISYLAEIPAVFISYEQLSANTDGKDKLIITRKTLRDSDGFRTRIDLQPKDHKLNRTMGRYLRRVENKPDAAEFLAARIVPERSVLAFLGGETPAFGYVLNDLTKYRSVNIDPIVARKPTPVGSGISLQSNGEGLAGSLYQLKNGTYFPGRAYNRFFGIRRIDPNLFKSIISWCKEVNPTIEDVEVKLDVMEAQLRPSMYFRHGASSEMFSFNRISDGTVKWLALATVLFAEPGLSLIEEPENFLHPFMQEAFVALCRQALKQDDERSLVISTHSPTLLDCCRPSELTLFELVEGRSRAARIANWLELERKLEASRFGLGHYYRIGALHGEDSGDS
jgi:predicted ATPase